MINKNDYGSYEAPEAIVFSVRTEDCFMDVSGTWDNSIKPGTNWDENEDDYGLE